MKTTNLLMLCVALTFTAAYAQSTPPASSIIGLIAEENGLQAVPFDQLPRCGTFYQILPSRNGCSAVPWPTPPPEPLPAYQVANHQFILDGLAGETVTEQILEAQTTSVVNLVQQIQAAEVAQELAEMMGMDLPPSPASGGEDDGDDLTNNYAFYNLNTNLLWLQAVSVTNATVYANLYNATNRTAIPSVYAIWSTTNLALPFSLWQVETEVFSTNTHCMPFTVLTLGRPDLFLRAQDWTGLFLNGLPCWWTWEYFHSLVPAAGDLDSLGSHTLVEDYTNGADPNVIRFEIALTNAYVQAANPSLPLNVLGGVPAYVAVLVNDDNPADAVWQQYSGSNVVAPLGPAGDYTVSVGLRGFPTNATESWETVTLIENTTPGYITNGLVAYWRLNDGNGTNAVDQVAGNNLTLKTVNTAPGSTLPQWGHGCLSFDGASQYCDGGNQPAFNITRLLELEWVIFDCF